MPATASSSGRVSELRARPCPGLPGALLLAAVAVAPAGCELLLDRDEIRICRVVLPALEPAGTGILLRRVGPEGGALRIDYGAIPASGGPALARFARCRFGPGRDLVGIATDRGEVSGARVFLLKRYYIDTPEGIAADPGPPPAGSLPEIPLAAARR